MKNLVIDSGVAVKWFVNEQYSTKAERIFDEYLTGQLFLPAPDFIYAEFGNVIWKKQTLQTLAPVDAARVIGDFRTQVQIVLTSTADLLGDVYPSGRHTQANRLRHALPGLESSRRLSIRHRR